MNLMRMFRAILLMVNTTFLIVSTVTILAIGPLFFLVEDAGSQLAILLITMLATLILLSTSTVIYHILQSEQP